MVAGDLIFFFGVTALSAAKTPLFKKIVPRSAISATMYAHITQLRRELGHRLDDCDDLVCDCADFICKLVQAAVQNHVGLRQSSGPLLE